MSIYSYNQRRNLILIVILIMIVFLCYAMRNMLPALLGSIIIYVLFRPLYRHLSEKKLWPTWISALSVMLLSFIILILPVITVLIMITDKIRKLFGEQIVISNFLKQIESYTGLNLHSKELIDKVVTMAQEGLLGGVSSIVNGVTGILLTLAIMYFILWYMFTSYKDFERIVLRYAPFREETSLKLGEELKKATYSNILGQGFIAFVQGALVTIGFFIFGISDAIFWGIISFFLSFMPVIGAPLVFVPAGIASLAAGDTFAGYGIILYGFILVTNIDNVLRFAISKYMVNIHPLITIIGVIFGIPLFGIIGLVFGPLMLSAFLLIVQVYDDDYLEGINKETTSPSIKSLTLEE